MTFIKVTVKCGNMLITGAHEKLIQASTEN